MSDGRDAGRARLDALMYRMLGGLLILGAAVLLGLVGLLLRLPHAVTPDGEMLVLPGTAGRHGVSPLALPVLGAGVLLMGLPGLLALALGRRQARFGPGKPGAAWGRSRRRPALVLLAGMALLAAVLLRR